MKSINYIILKLLVIAFLTSCSKFVETDLPKTDLVTETVFASDQTALAAISNVYAQLTTNSFASGSINSFTFYAGLSADELDLYSTNELKKQFFDSQIRPENTELGYSLWTLTYSLIYKVNAIIEGLSNSTRVSSTLKTQLDGEAKFVRAFCYFYLINSFGDVPLVLTTDYRINAVIPKSAKTVIYQQIIKDLKESKAKLSIDYSYSNNERVRPNKFTASAFLSRVYLYTEDWENSEIEATLLINNKVLYDTVALNDVFLKNSKEAIWQLIKDNGNTNDATTFVINTTRPANAALKPSFFNAFDPADKRKGSWVGTKISGVNTYYFPNKYKNTVQLPPVNEYSMVLRLAEQYLIRAEARARLNRITGSNGAENDINVIRKRAGLSGTTAIVQSDMLLAIERERKFELFTEWGHRWLDLKRTNRADIILAMVKGTNWQTTDQLYPIPVTEIIANPSLKGAQNPGY